MPEPNEDDLERKKVLDEIENLNIIKDHLEEFSDRIKRKKRWRSRRITQLLTIRYNLEFGDRDLHKLSPGEKGVLLLVFFLLAEKDTKPIIIDQPEDNLDNKTVFNVLVDCFKKAKEIRQVIMVTHNPNLAVVCDSDQIIEATMEKDNENEIKYNSGPLEDSEIVEKIIDILEGTKPAFDSRVVTYKNIF